MIYSPENMNLMNRKQKVRFGGKQLIPVYNPYKGKLRYTLFNVNKLEFLVCLTEKCERNFFGGGKRSSLVEV